MASYLRCFLRSHDSSKTDNSNTSFPTKSRSQQRSVSFSPTKEKRSNYIYSEPRTSLPTPIQPSHIQGNSPAAARPNAASAPCHAYNSRPSLLGPLHHDERHPHLPTPQQAPRNPQTFLLYKPSRYGVGERSSPHPTCIPTNPSQSISSSDSSFYPIPHGNHQTLPSRNSSTGSVTTQSTFQGPKSVLKHNGHAGDNHKQNRHAAHVSFQNPNRSTLKHMHPLLSCGYTNKAPILYDIIFPPSSRSIIDRHTHTAIPPFTLTQPATEPPTYGCFILQSDKLPWQITVTSGYELSRANHTKKRFYIDSPSLSTPHSEPTGSNDDRKAVSNFDVLYAVHATLAVQVTQVEWDSLGGGSHAQRKATRAYEKRCTDMGGGWGDGVRRVDFLGGDTRLAGIEIVTGRTPGEETRTIGKLIFSCS